MRRVLDGPPLALPPALDRIAEWWAQAGPRVRVAFVALTVVLGLVVAGRGAARSPWGQARPVLVARAHLPAGHVIEEGDVAVHSWPDRVVPSPAPSEVADVVGRPLAAAVPPGTAVSGAHVAEDGLADELADGEVAVPLPLPDGIVVAAGQRLDVLAGDGGGGGMRVASAARVLSVEGTLAWVAVARDEAPAVAGAAHWGEVNLALLPD